MDAPGRFQQYYEMNLEFLHKHDAKRRELQSRKRRWKRKNASKKCPEFLRFGTAEQPLLLQIWLNVKSAMHTKIKPKRPRIFGKHCTSKPNYYGNKNWNNNLVKQFHCGPLFRLFCKLLFLANYIPCTVFWILFLQFPAVRFSPPPPRPWCAISQQIPKHFTRLLQNSFHDETPLPRRRAPPVASEYRRSSPGGGTSCRAACSRAQITASVPTDSTPDCLWGDVCPAPKRVTIPL